MDEGIASHENADVVDSPEKTTPEKYQISRPSVIGLYRRTQFPQLS
jgi:hypothetical protein